MMVVTANVWAATTYFSGKRPWIQNWGTWLPKNSRQAVRNRSCGKRVVWRPCTGLEQEVPRWGINLNQPRPCKLLLGVLAGNGRVLHGRWSHLSIAAYLRKVYDLGNTQKYFCSNMVSAPTISLSLLKNVFGWLAGSSANGHLTGGRCAVSLQWGYTSTAIEMQLGSALIFGPLVWLSTNNFKKEANYLTEYLRDSSDNEFTFCKVKYPHFTKLSQQVQLPQKKKDSLSF